MRKIIITIAPTGNVPTKKLNRHVPISPQEIAEDIFQCYKAGAAIAHIHTRDENGSPTTNPVITQDIMTRVKERCDIIIQLSTGARGGSGQERGVCIDLKPDMASLATGSSNFSASVNSNSPELIESLGKRMIENGVKPEIEAFDVAMITNIGYYLKKEAVKPPLHFNLVMNVPGSISGTPKNLLHMAELLPQGSTFTVTGIGRAHVDMITMGVLLGGNIRVGLEDVLLYSDESGELASNVMLVERAVRIVHALGHEVATVQEARSMLGL
jgi:3-keto-5-aminohexanoate cleavage enzyme